MPDSPLPLHRYHPDYTCEHLHIGIVMSRFNLNICEKLLAACTEELLRLGVKPHNIHIATVPGALEIPLILKKMAQRGPNNTPFHALIALGAVVRGETYHFELVSNEMAAGITRVTLDAGLPIANGVLTTENEEQALARTQEKGSDCARAAIEMANLLREIQ